MMTLWLGGAFHRHSVAAGHETTKTDVDLGGGHRPTSVKNTINCKLA